MKFSNKEIKDLFIAWLMISVAFAILLSGGIKSFLSFNVLVISLIVSGLTVGISFLFHELMHKFLAQKYHLWAEFRAYYQGLFLAILFSLFGFIIAAPGAVVIQGRMNKEINGKISLAGPLTNIILAIVFLLFTFTIDYGNFLGLFLSYGLTINSLLAAFNMIPIRPFDGKGVYDWSKPVYFITLIIAAGLFLLSLSI